MLAHQFLLAFWFYIIFSLFAGVGLFLTLRLLPENRVIAYFTAKVLGLAFFGYVIWLLASLHILSYQNQPILVSLYILGAVGGLIWSGRQIYQSTDKKQLKQLVKNILWLELCSLLLYYGYLWLRSYSPAAFGTERFMDMTLLNSTYKAQYFPFTDAWYAGKNVNYYYYGHYLVSVISRLSGVTTFLTYNFALGLLYSTAFLLAAFLVYLATKSKSFAFLGGFLVTTAGSMFYSGCVINTWLKGQAICSYASSTRLYTPSYIINEIPSYSFTVGDLHAHFLALPFMLLNLILAYLLFKSKTPSKTLSFSLLIALTASALVNPSDVTTLAVLLTLIWLYKVYPAYKNRKSYEELLTNPEPRPWYYLAIFLCVGILVLYAPFLLHFKSPVLGFGFVPAFAIQHHLWLNGNQVPTPLMAELGMWGVYVLSIAAALWFLRKTLKEHGFWIVAFITAIFLIIFVELFFVKDIYHIANPPYFRANTVFKYGYHTWTLLCVSFAVMMAAVFNKLSLTPRGKKMRSVLKWIMALFIFFCLFYPYQAIQQFYLTSNQPLTLDASAFMNGQSADDLNTINWINQNIKTRSVILEAVGDSYTYYARMSAFTGMITPMGWKTHEWTWRFDGAAAEKILAKDPTANVETGYGAIAGVANDVQLMYESPSIQLTQQLLNEYGVQYVYIGNLERTTYTSLDEQKFDQLGTVVYQSGNSKLYKIN